MTPITAFQVLSKQVTTHPNEILKLEWRGGDSALATGLFIQLWDTNTGPVAGVMPADAVLQKAYPMIGGAGTGPGAYDYKEFKPGEGEMEFKLGVWVGVSTTEATYTAAAGNNLLAMVSVELRRLEAPAGVSTVGDFATAESSLIIWSQATGLANRQKLVKLEIDGTNLGAGDKWLMIFAQDAPPTTGQTPMLVRIITPGAKYTGVNALTFGIHGADILQAVNGVYYYGCSVAFSSTANTWTAPTGTGTIYGEFAVNP